MESWKLLAIFTPLLFVTYQTLSKLLPKSAPLFLVTALSSLIGALVMFILHFQSGNKVLLNGKILLLTIFIGLLISVGNFLIMKAYNLGAPQSSFVTIFYPLLILYGIVFGILLWKEGITILQAVGIVLIIVGLGLVSHFRK